MEVYAILSWLSVNEGPVTVTGRHAEVPPSGLPHSDRRSSRKDEGRKLHEAGLG